MTDERPSDFRAQVEALLAAGKLSGGEAQGLLEGLEEPAAPPLLPDVVPGEQAPGDTPPDLRLKVVGYALAVVVDPALSAPHLSANLPDELRLQAAPGGWQLERRTSPDTVQVLEANLRAILSVPFVPRDVRAELHGGNLTLPDLAGRLEAEVNGGNLTAGRVAGPVRATINGGNLSVSGASGLQASVNGGNLKWSGMLAEGKHTLEVNAGNAALHLLPGSSLRLDADVTVGSFRADFETHQQGGPTNTRRSGQLGGGAASLVVKVAAGQVKVVTQ